MLDTGVRRRQWKARPRSQLATVPTASVVGAGEGGGWAHGDHTESEWGTDTRMGEEEGEGRGEMEGGGGGGTVVGLDVAGGQRYVTGVLGLGEICLVFLSVCLSVCLPKVCRFVYLFVFLWGCCCCCFVSLGYVTCQRQDESVRSDLSDHRTRVSCLTCQTTGRECHV